MVTVENRLNFLFDRAIIKINNNCRFYTTSITKTQLARDRVPNFEENLPQILQLQKYGILSTLVCLTFYPQCILSDKIISYNFKMDKFIEQHASQRDNDLYSKIIQITSFFNVNARFRYIYIIKTIKKICLHRYQYLLIILCSIFWCTKADFTF